MLYQLRNLLKTQNILQVQRQIRNKHKIKIQGEMGKAYLRHLPEGDKFDLSFQLNCDELKVNRFFNFSRSLSESASALLNRISINIEKQVNKKRKKVPDADPVKVDAHLYLGSEKVQDQMLCEQIFKENNNVTLELLRTKFEVVINSPYIDNIALPQCIQAEFPVYPAKIEHVFCNFKLSTFHWSKSKDKKNWQDLGEGFIFTPEKGAINHYLRLVCLPANERRKGPSVEVISDVVVQASPGICPFENRHLFTQEKTNENEFRVVSYNILADLYCDSDFTRTVLHPYCPPYALAFDYRKQLILKEVIGYKGDIICLQEVDRKFYNHDLQVVLGNLNYGSNFALKGGEVAEGVACFYNLDKFSLISNENVVMSEHLEHNPLFQTLLDSISKNEKLKERFLERKNVLQLIALTCSNGSLVLVANTHLYFHPDADHIRLLQAAMAIKFAEDYYNKLKQKFIEKKISIIFCGDFNSVPECGIYKLYTTGNVDSSCADWISNKEEAVKDLSLLQPFKLGSACGTPKYTNFTVEFADCLDYIFYDQNLLEVAQVIPFPSVDELKANTALPSVVFPSDHISLCVDLKWK